MASSLLSSVTGGGVLPQLAPDLKFPSDKNSLTNTTLISGIDGSSGLTTALSLTGKFIVSYISLANFVAETSTVKLTIDGVVIWNDTFTTATGTDYFIGNVVANYTDVTLQCNSSFLLEIATTTDTSVDLTYVARPIL